MEKTAAQKIREMAAQGESSRIPTMAEMLVEQAYGENCYDGREITLQLARLKEHAEFTPQMAVKSSVFIAGFIKRLYGRLARAVLAPAFRQQSMYNMEIASCMWKMKEESDRREKELSGRVEELEQRLSALEARLNAVHANID